MVETVSKVNNIATASISKINGIAYASASKINGMTLASSWWSPWANTLAYYTLTADANDYSGNSRNGTNVWWNVTFSSNGWLFNNSNTFISIPVAFLNGVYPLTVNFWSYQTATQTNNDCKQVDFRATSTYSLTLQWNYWWGTGWYWVSSHYWTAMWINTNNLYLNTRKNVCIVIDWWYAYYYLDWTLYWTRQSIGSTTWNPTAWWIWNEYNNWLSRHFQWYIKNVIFENKAWSDTEASSYYNNTK